MFDWSARSLTVWVMPPICWVRSESCAIFCAISSTWERMSVSPPSDCSMAASLCEETWSAFSVSLSTVSAFWAASSDVCLISCAVTCVSWSAVAWRVMVWLWSLVLWLSSPPALLRSCTDSCSARSTSFIFSTIWVKAAASSPTSSFEVTSTCWVRSPSTMRLAAWVRLRRGATKRATTQREMNAARTR